MSVTTQLDRCDQWQLNPKHSYFHHLAGGRVAGVDEEASPNENTKRTTIHYRLLVPMRRLARRSVLQMIQYIYAQPQTCLKSGYAKKILPLTADTAELAPARILEWSPIGVWRFCVVSWTRTLWQGSSITPPKTTLYITCKTSLTCTAPQKRRLGPGMCWDDAYVKINYMAP